MGEITEKDLKEANEFEQNWREGEEKARIWKAKHPILDSFITAYWFCYRTIRDIPYKVRCFRWYFVRGWKGWAPNDTWGFSHYLNRVISEGVEHLRKHTHGYPGIDEADTPEKWDAILKQISEDIICIDKFEEEEEYYSMSVEERESKWLELRARQEKALQLMSKWWGHLWD